MRPFEVFNKRTTPRAKATSMKIQHDPHQLAIPEDGPLLIATTLLAGAEHLLDDPEHSFLFHFPPVSRPHALGKP